MVLVRRDHLGIFNPATSGRTTKDASAKDPRRNWFQSNPWPTKKQNYPLEAPLICMGIVFGYMLIFVLVLVLVLWLVLAFVLAFVLALVLALELVLVASASIWHLAASGLAASGSIWDHL